VPAYITFYLENLSFEKIFKGVFSLAGMAKELIILFSVVSLLMLVSAQEIPPARAPEPLVRIVNCTDSDGGLNYYNNGIIFTEVVRWTDHSRSFYPPENTGQGRDYCSDPMNSESINTERSCEPSKKLLNEAYCTDKEIDLVRKQGQPFPNVPEYKIYDCSTEGKVCYKGICINKNDAARDPDYIREKANCEKQMERYKEQRAQYLIFWKRIYSWFYNPSGKISFSETSGLIKDSDGNPIIGASVTMDALCSIKGFATPAITSKAITDEKGNFNFNSLEIKSPLPSSKCRKGFVAFKKGYCPYSRSIDYFHCLRGIAKRNLPNVEPEVDVDFASDDTTTIGAREKNAVLILKKVNIDTIQQEISDLDKEFSTKQLETAPSKQ